MAEFPVPLDNLIAYVKTLHPEGGPLENVSDAFAVSEQLDEQSDALLGYFVDQARRSGLPWSQIGAAMGVSKQAAQKRFVPGQAGDHLRAGGFKTFSRFTDRAVRVLFAADHLAADRPAGRSSGQAGGERNPRRDRRGAAGGRVPLRAGRAGGEGHRQGGPHRRAGLRRGRHRAGPAAAERGPGDAERAGLRRFHQGRVQGGAQVGAAHGPQLHRHRAPAARGAVHRRPGRRGVHRPRPDPSARRGAAHRRARRLLRRTCKGS